MSTKTPTPQAVSRLLRQAGFERSSYGDQAVMWDEVTTGFSVWTSRHQNAPQQPYVAVQHVIKDAGHKDWPESKREMLARLEDYAKVIREAGYPALVRDRGDEPPWLIILSLVAANDSTGTEQHP